MGMHPLPAVWSVAACLMTGPYGFVLGAAEPVIRCDPAVAVGQSDSANQYQTDLRVHPGDPRAMVITAKRGNREAETMAFTTRDGGTSWSTQLLAASGDPDAVYSNSGVVVWSYIDQSHAKAMGVMRSLDGGLTWLPPAVLGAKVDHAQIACDRSASAYSGSLYYAGRLFSGTGIAIARSRNDGADWTISTVAVNAQYNLGFVRSVQVCSDGTVLIALTSKNNITSSGGVYTGNTCYHGTVRSIDGGVTFAPVVEVATDGSTAADGPGGSRACIMAVGRQGTGERAYLVYAQTRRSPAGAQLMLATSDDRGLTWTAPRAIITPPAGSGVGNCNVMVNRTGTVGVQYYLHDGDGRSDICFAASNDGGTTFPNPVRLTPTSCLEPDAQHQPREPGGDQVMGDAASDGAFHLVWPDPRSGTRYIAYTQQVVVDPVDPRITSTPGLTVTLGQTYRYQLVGTGMPTPRYTLVSGPAGMAVDPISGALVWTPTAVGSFTVTLQAGNGGMPAQQRFVITVAAAATTPAFTTQPASRSVSVGQTATFTVVASGTPAPTYQWQRNGTRISGATRASYTTPAAVIGDNGAVYRCIATNSAGSATSGPAVLTVSSPVPVWTSTDLGGQTPAGSTTVVDDRVSVAGGGADIWGTSDAFRFVSQEMSGDGEITVRVVSLNGPDSWSKAGVMIRESLSGGSRQAMTAVTPGNGVAFQRRLATGGASSHTSGGRIAAPCWIRLSRTGDVFTSYQSLDGATWQAIGSASITMGTKVFVGLAVSSHTTSSLATAVFDAITIVAAPSGGA